MTIKVARPENLKRNSAPTDGYLLCVDGKIKTRYETSQQAMTAGEKLKINFPAIQVSIFDAAKNNYEPIELPEKVQ